MVESDDNTEPVDEVDRLEEMRKCMVAHGLDGLLTGEATTTHGKCQVGVVIPSCGHNQPNQTKADPGCSSMPSGMGTREYLRGNLDDQQKVNPADGRSASSEGLALESDSRTCTTGSLRSTTSTSPG